MGLSTDQLIDFYLAEYNQSHSAREQITRSWLLPKRQKSRGWMVPALLIVGAIFGLGLALKRLVGRSRPQKTPDATDAPTVSEAERARVLNALDDMEQDGEW